MHAALINMSLNVWPW